MNSDSRWAYENFAIQPDIGFQQNVTASTLARPTEPREMLFLVAADQQISSLGYGFFVIKSNIVFEQIVTSSMYSGYGYGSRQLFTPVIGKQIHDVTSLEM